MRSDMLICHDINSLLVVDTSCAQSAHTFLRHVKLGANAVLKSLVQVEQDWTSKVLAT